MSSLSEFIVSKGFVDCAEIYLVFGVSGPLSGPFHRSIEERMRGEERRGEERRGEYTVEEWRRRRGYY